ncbi:pyocin knob domain-containing S74 family peptidase [Flagellimonas onchidii]|uniref:pyocin knob domain-containing S74 family peptidase n=1 Tax=Flagellimonas onchidii TaxID=2562684 RepID=UPI0010A69CBB|nr:pyocin knob domain-containing S74 family peptidase [Allomuricauda onchidii]
MKRDNTTLKTYFETGDYPTEVQFSDLIDSFLNIEEEDAVTGITNNGDGTYTFQLLSGGTEVLDVKSLPDSIPIATVVGLQALLDGKVSKSGDTMQGDLELPNLTFSDSTTTFIKPNTNNNNILLIGGNGAGDKDWKSIHMYSNGVFRINDNDIWHEGNDNDLFPLSASELPGGQDLNTYQTAGFYYQSANADAASGSNYPEAKAGSLVVQKSAGVTQQYYTYNDGSPEVFFRGYYNGAWSSWIRLARTNDWLDQFLDASDGSNRWSFHGRDVRSNGKRAFVGFSSSDGNYLAINYGGDFANGTRVFGSFLRANEFRLEDTSIRIYSESGTSNIADTFSDTTTYKRYINFSAGPSSNDPGYIMHETSNSETNEGVLHLCPSDDNGFGDYVSIHGTNDPDILRLHTDGTIEGVNDIHGRVINGVHSNLYRFAGIFFTWDADNYGTNTHHSIRSTYGDTYGDDITINSYHHLRINIDSNNNNSDAKFQIGHNTTGTGNVIFTVNENGTVVGSSTITASNFILSSDERLKSNVQDVEPARINAKWKTFLLKDEKEKRYGVIAQELEKEHPEFVRTNDEGYKSVAYVDLLVAKNAELEARVEKLEKLIEKLI